jgi:hypothetical protein
MEGEYKLNFGSYKDKTIQEVAKDFPSYLLWIGGKKTKYSLTKQAQEIYAVICQENPKDVQAVKDFLLERCSSCWCKLIEGKKHSCELKKAEKFYHYHPYGKRT